MKNEYRLYAFMIFVFLAFGITPRQTFAFNNGIEIKGDWVYLNGKKFFINAVGYAGWRPHQWPGTDKVDLRLVDLDFKRIKKAGFNTIRTWDALGPEELALAKKYGLKVIQGIWLDPTHDLSDIYFVKDSLEYVEKVVKWSKGYDNVLMYLVITEPRQEAILAAGEEKTLEFFKNLKRLIQSIDNRPVSMDSWIPLGFLDHSVWDIVTFNAFMFTPESINRTIGFRNYIRWFKNTHATNKPLLIGETGGFSVSKAKLNDLGFGGNTEQEQANGDIKSIRQAITAGAAGTCVVSWIDTWHYPSNPDLHDDHPWEWDGIMGIKDGTDLLGTPRKIYHAMKYFNKKLAPPHNQGPAYSPFKINIVPLKSEFNVGDNIKIMVRIEKEGKPFQNQKIDTGFFLPLGWKEEVNSYVTDNNGRFLAKCKLTPDKLNQYLIFSFGFQSVKERYGDIKFIKINYRDEQKFTDEFPIYIDKDFPNNHFFPSGWTGDYPDLRLDDSYSVAPHSEKTCIKITYTARNAFGGGWVGICWQNPLNNWDSPNGGFDLTRFSRLTFWAKGSKGGEKIFQAGVGGNFPNTVIVNTGPIILENNWKQYSIDLKDKDMSLIIHGFHIFVRKDENSVGCTFYLDDITFQH